LEIVPLLLPERDQAAKDILALVGRYCNAKEVIIATQEASERIRAIDTPDLGDDKSDKRQSLPSQLVSLADLYSSCEINVLIEGLQFHSLQA
jgi:hypothetical protein